MTTRMEGALRALHQGEITFRKFERATRQDWDKLSGKMFNRWPLPPGVTEEDVRQEMLLAAWRAVAKYDPTKGVSLASFVVWTACNAAAKWLHRQRKARNKSGREPSRFPLTMGALRIDPDGELGESELLDLFASVEPEQEARADHARMVAAIEGMAETPVARDALRVWMLTGGDVVEAGVNLWFDVVARADHGFRSRRHAKREVERVVRDVQRALVVQEGAS